MEVYDNDNIVADLPNFLNKWKYDFESLYNVCPEPRHFDGEFYSERMSRLHTDNEDYLRELDNDITNDKVRKAINQTHNNMAVGLENLSCEIFKNNGFDEILTLLFNKIYELGLIPSIWYLAIIKPIPKHALADSCLPLEYWGISLLSTVYKLFTNILNNRIVQTAEINSSYSDEQNGFKKIDSVRLPFLHFSSIIRNRKRERLSFVDFEKPFDWVDRNLIFSEQK